MLNLPPVVVVELLEVVETRGVNFDMRKGPLFDEGSPFIRDGSEECDSVVCCEGLQDHATDLGR